MQRKIEDLQRQLEEERERHERAADELKEKRRELDDEQQKLLQQQIDEQNKRLQMFSILISSFFELALEIPSYQFLFVLGLFSYDD